MGNCLVMAAPFCYYRNMTIVLFDDAIKAFKTTAKQTIKSVHEHPGVSYRMNRNVKLQKERKQ